MTKVCTKCLISKSISEYYIAKGKSIAACKECTKRSTRNYALKSGKIKGNYGRSRFEALFDKKINDWTVIGTELIKGKNTKVLCRCKCGIEQYVMCIRLEKKASKGCKKCHPIYGSNSHLFKGVGEISSTYLRHLAENAHARNIPIQVSGEQMWRLYLEQDKKCALTGLDIDFGKHIHRQKTKSQSQTASLDRIDSNKGYTVGNLQWVHKHVNIMKNKYDNEYFKQICKLVVDYDNKT